MDFTTSWHRSSGATVRCSALQCSPAKSFAKLPQHFGDLAVPWLEKSRDFMFPICTAFVFPLKLLPRKILKSECLSHCSFTYALQFVYFLHISRPGPRGLSSSLQPQRAPQRTGPRRQPFHRRPQRHVCFVALKTQKSDSTYGTTELELEHPVIFAIIGGVYHRQMSSLHCIQ